MNPFMKDFKTYLAEDKISKGSPLDCAIRQNKGSYMDCKVSKMSQGFDGLDITIVDSDGRVLVELTGIKG